MKLLSFHLLQEVNLISVQEADFNISEEYQKLLDNDTSSGAVVLFVGRVREMNQGYKVNALYLEHYPAMTQHYLISLVKEAKRRWPLEKVRVIHRIGALKLSDQIVLVAVTSPHREAAFAGAQYIMDLLKTQAPFWKKELQSDGRGHWVKANTKDVTAAEQWSKK
ncbi:UNVERIFIED_CONTAM: hypothetical protein GTU68_052156 [Idotea baltica]|nr:hypothetical protein [Idotea baltica]